MKIYRVAILGCRGRGAAAARAYHAHPRTEIVGLCDLIAERRNSLGDALNVTARFADLDEMIQETVARHRRNSYRHRVALRFVYARVRTRCPH